MLQSFPGVLGRAVSEIPGGDPPISMQTVPERSQRAGKCGG